MKKALLALVALSFLAVGLAGCNSEEKKLETSAPPTSPNATTFSNGGQPKPIGARDENSPAGPQGPALKPQGT
jgi:hypothetical protein